MDDDRAVLRGGARQPRNQNGKLGLTPGDDASARFVAPAGGRRADLLNALGNLAWWRAFRRATIARLPFPRLRSDVTEVTYATWLVPVDRVATLVPGRVTVASRDGMTPLTVLSYRHGHFGPALFGPARRLFPSPLQSNWRLYVAAVDGVAPARRTVLFVANLFDRALYALGTRLMSDALPSHLPARFDLDDGGVAIDGGGGSSPSLQLETAGSPTHPIPSELTAWFGGVDNALAAICLQDAAVTRTPDDRLAQAWIDLPIDLERIEPRRVTNFVPGALLTAVGATRPPWCFRVPRVRFTVLGERLV